MFIIGVEWKTHNEYLVYLICMRGSTISQHDTVTVCKVLHDSTQPQTTTMVVNILHKLTLF